MKQNTMKKQILKTVQGNLFTIPQDGAIELNDSGLWIVIGTKRIKYKNKTNE